MSTSPESLTVQIVRVVDSPRERVWRAFTTEELAQWYWPASYGPTFEVDAQAGGRYRFAATTLALAVSGEFTKVAAPGHLAYSWQWDGDDLQTQVTMSLAETSAGTEVTLVHEGFRSAVERESHLAGWASCLDRLPPHLAGQRG
jgi:uncharacterized protein YndB with AHSA1/START domain